MKLRGRPTTPDRRRGRTLSPGARGAKPLTPQGPLQRLLGVTMKPFRQHAIGIPWKGLKVDPQAAAITKMQDP